MGVWPVPGASFGAAREEALAVVDIAMLEDLSEVIMAAAR